jgi:hypothetical protein
MQVLVDVLSKINAGLEQFISPIPLTINPLAPLDVATQLRAVPGVVSANAKPILLGVSLDGPVLYIDDAGVTVIGQFANTSTPVAGQLPDAPGNLDDQAVTAAFTNLKTKVVGIIMKLVPGFSPPTTPWAAISRASVAKFAVSALAESDLSLVYRLSNFDQSFKSGPIQPFNYESISCPLDVDQTSCPLRTCQQQVDSRNCNQPHDERNCRKRVLGAEINDPGCEALKAAQNKIYDANRAACEGAKAAQNVLYAGQVVACQADAGRLKGECETAKGAQNAIFSAKKLACETGKEAVKRVQLTGPVGEVHGDVTAKGTFSLSASAFSLDAGLHSASVNLSISGEADLAGNIGFQPYNAGVAMCSFPWQEPFSTKASIPMQAFTEQVSIDMQNTSGTVNITAWIQLASA